MDLNIFEKIKILDSGMGQELIARGLVTRGTLWSATSLIDEKYNQLVIDTHLASINAGADVILTNTFTTRRVRMEENRVKDKFLFANKKACELAIKAKDLSKKNILIAGSLPAQNNTYEADKREDNVIVVIDSIGNLASKKELEDALSEKSVADMSRAKALKGLFRMSTPYLKMKNIPLIAVNHTYKEIGLFPKDVVGGGTGIYYSADNIWIVGRQQDKTGTEIKGYHFIINIDKSRYVKEKSKIPISVAWEGGIQCYSGLLDVAVNGGYIVKPSNGWYMVVDKTTGETIGNKVREKDTLNSEFWTPIFETTDFKDYIKQTYSI